MRRSDHPSRPRAMTCCFFSSFKTLAMPTEPTSLRPASMSQTLLSLAGFQVILIGRFWVIAEAPYLAHYSSRDGRSVPNDNNCDWVKPAFQEIYRVLRWN